MSKPGFRSCVVCFTLGILMGGLLANNATGADAIKLNVNDISFLWPVPQSEAEADRLISAQETLSDGTDLWPLDIFNAVLATAPTIEAEPGQPILIPTARRLEERVTWKVAGIRVDPSFSLCDQSSPQDCGAVAQIRLILQPVSSSPRLRVHDFAAHLTYNFATLANGKPAPDTTVFAKIIKDLVELKQELKQAGISTDDTLGVHPGFLVNNEPLTEKLRTLLKTHLSGARLQGIGFMGIRPPEPWIFFLMRRMDNGQFQSVPLTSANGHKAIQLITIDSRFVIPDPTTSTFGGALRVSTAQVFRANGNLDAAADGKLIAALGRPLLVREIPDVVANPKLANVFNMDCVSCHTETSLRQTRNIPPADPALVFPGPAPKANVLPVDDWNVRNFGWGVGRRDRVMATVVQRTANEAAQSAEMINRVYLGAQAMHTPVSNPLTLLLKASNQTEYDLLKTEVVALQALPPAQNPIVQALERLRSVHYARFVFLDESLSLMVITTYDDDFDTYIETFAAEIGPVFDKILKHIKDAPPLPVRDHPDEFLEFVKANDIPPTGDFYRAYPDLRVRDITNPGR